MQLQLYLIYMLLTIILIDMRCKDAFSFHIKVLVCVILLSITSVCMLSFQISATTKSSYKIIHNTHGQIPKRHPYVIFFFNIIGLKSIKNKKQISKQEQLFLISLD